MSALLDVQKISIAFGGLKAVSEFSLTVEAGTLQGLIGPNGAGKTTVFNLLTGVYAPQEGRIMIDGKEITGLRPFQITAKGIARTFQNIRLFGDLSVLDNVRIACHLRAKSSLAAALAVLPAQRREEAEIYTRAMELLKIFNLDHRAQEDARHLPYGDQRRLEIARALATNPKLLLLDEPAAGMNPQEKIALRELILKIRKMFNLTVLLIEHDMGVVMDLCENITVLDYGMVIARGTPAEIQAHPKVIEAYLGTPQEVA